jgi:ribonuclease P protein component
MSSSAGARKAGSGLPCDRKLRRHERITEQYEYRQVISKGTVLLGKRFRAYLLLNGTTGRKAGFIAGKRVGNACQRNRARRLLREAYRDLKPNVRDGAFGVVFVASRGIAGADLEDVESDMKSMLTSLSLLARAGDGGSPRC